MNQKLAHKGILELEHFIPLAWLRCFASYNIFTNYQTWAHLNHFTNLSLWKNTINGLKGDLILLSWFWDWLRGCNVPDTNQTNRQQALARKHVLECDTNDRAVFKRTGRDVVIKRRFAETSSSNRIRDARRRIPADNQLRDRLLGGEFHFLVIDTETVSLDDRNAFQIAIVDPADPDRQLNSESLNVSLFLSQYTMNSFPFPQLPRCSLPKIV